MFTVLEIQFNLVAIVAAAVASMVLGYIWYHPSVFGNTWLKMIGLTESSAAAGAGMAMLGATLASIFTAVTMTVFLHYGLGMWDLALWLQGAILGGFLWFGFILPVMFTNASFEQRSMKLFWIEVLYQLFNFVIVGAIIAVWR